MASCVSSGVSPERVFINHACDPWTEVTPEDCERVNTYVQGLRSGTHALAAFQRNHLRTALAQTGCADSTTLGGYLLNELDHQQQLQAQQQLDHQQPQLMLQQPHEKPTPVYPINGVSLVLILVLALLVLVAAAALI